MTPSLAQGRFIRQTIESVLNQDYEPLEYIVVDGGSRDETLDVLREYGERLALIAEPDHGQADAINKGWRLARGEVLAWLNADDLYLPGAVTSAVRAFVEHPEADLVHAHCIEIGERGEPLRRLRACHVALRNLLLLQGGVHQPTVFLRRTLLETVGPLDPGCHLAPDYDLYLRAALSGAVLHHVTEDWAAMRIHPLAKSQRLADGILPEHLRILERVAATAEAADFGNLLREARARAFLEEGARVLDRGLLERARACLRESLRLRGFRPSAVTLRTGLLLLDATLGVAAGRFVARALRRLGAYVGAHETREEPWPGSRRGALRVY